MRKVALIQGARRRIAWALTIAVRILTATLVATAAPDEALDKLPLPDRFVPAATLTLKGLVFHVQGLDMDGDFIFVTSVDRRTGRGFLHKFTADGNLIGVVDLTDGPRYHVGGVSLDADSIWIPVAEYRPHSTTRIVQLSKRTLQVISSFTVEDHIGALAVDAAQIYGADWDAERFYIWNCEGKILATSPNPTRMAYQDLKIVDGSLVASGGMRDWQTGAVDWLDPVTLSLRQRLPVGKMDNGLLWTREGMAIDGHKLYLLPNDGHDGGTEIFMFPLEDLKADVLQCGEGFSSCGSAPQSLASR